MLLFYVNILYFLYSDRRFNKNSFDFLNEKKYHKSQAHHGSVCVFREDDPDKREKDWGLSLRSRRSKVKASDLPLTNGSDERRRPPVGGSATVTRQYEYDLVEYAKESQGSCDSLPIPTSISVSPAVSAVEMRTPSPDRRSVTPPPGATPVVLTEENVDKYFGVKAQHHFNATFRELHGRRNLCVGGDDELMSLISTPLAAIGINGSLASCGSVSPAKALGGSHAISLMNKLGSPSILKSQSQQSCSDDGTLVMSAYGGDSLSQSVKQLRKHRVLDPIVSPAAGVAAPAELGIEHFEGGSSGLVDSDSVLSSPFNSSPVTTVGKGSALSMSSKSNKKSYYVLPRHVAANKGRSSNKSRLHNIKYPCGPHTKNYMSPQKLVPLYPSIEDGLLESSRSIMGGGDSQSVMSDITLGASVDLDLEEENLAGEDYEVDDPHDIGNMLYNHYDSTRVGYGTPGDLSKLLDTYDGFNGEASFGLVTADVMPKDLSSPGSGGRRMPRLNMAGLRTNSATAASSQSTTDVKANSRVGAHATELSGDILMEDCSFQSDTSLSTYGPNSPRAKFLAGCLKFNLPPRSLAILRHRYTTILNLEHHGLGDQFGLLFAQSFGSLPVVRVLNIADNRLTDKSLGPLVQAVWHSRTLEELNLSANQIGPVCASALAGYLSSPNCSIVFLKLAKLKLTDATVMTLLGALTTNDKLQELDLSSNLLGQEEALMFMHPGRITGGESVGKLVRNASVSALTTLKLQWNFIRGIGSMDLCDSIRSKSSTITYLDLSFNSIGSDGGSVLGSALLENRVLKELYIASNNINAEACFAICVGCKDSVVEHLNIDNNPIGGLGAQMLMSLAIAKREELTFSAIGSDLTAKTDVHVIDINDPVGSYEVTLSSALGRAITFELLDICARNPVFRIQQFVVLPEGGDPNSGDFDISRASPIKGRDSGTVPAVSAAASKDGGDVDADTDAAVETPVVEEEVDYGDWVPVPMELFEESVTSLADTEKELVKHLEVHAQLISDMARVDTCFKKYKDKGLLQILTQSGFVKFLNELGYEVNLRDAIALIRSLDSGTTESIGEENVRHLLREIALRAQSQLREVKFRTRCCELGKEGQRYIPPKVGKVRIEIVRSYLPKIDTKTVTPCQVIYMEKAAYVSHDPGIMLQYGVQQVRCHVREGDKLVSLLKKDLGDATVALAKVLPQMVNTNEAAKLARIHVGNSYERRQKLKAILGHAFGPLLGHCDGYYSLSMQCENDRVCLVKLMEQSLSKAAMRKELHLGDLSQNGDWYCFRNQVIDGVSVLDEGGIDADIRITKEHFTPLPKHGHVEFDFSSGSSLHGQNMDDSGAPVVAIHDHKMVQLLTDCGLLQHTAAMERGAHRQLDEMKRGMERALQGFGYKYWQVDEGRAEIMGQYIHQHFYGNLLDRHNQHVTANQLYAKPAAPKDDVAKEHNAPLKGRHHSHEKVRGGAFGGLGGGGANGGPFGAAVKATVAAAALVLGTSEECDESALVVDDDEDEDDSEVVDRVDDINDPKLLMRRIPSSPTGLSPIKKKKKRGGGAAALVPHYNINEKIFMPSFTADLIAQAGRDLNSERPEQKFKGLKRFQTLDSVFNLLGPVHAIPVHDFFQNKMSTSFMLSRHLALLVSLYDDGRAKHSDFGTYRVELVVSLFCRVLDKHNFELVLMKLTAMEHACLIARLGVLNLYNPWKPDGCHYLELGHWDERQVAKMIIHLDIVEPGVNWLVAKMKANYSAPPTPGWVLNESWMTEEGLSKSAILIVKYYSGDGCRINNVTPFRSLRNALLSLVLVDPLCLVSEREDATRDAPAVTIHHRTSSGISDESAELLNRVCPISVANSLLKKCNISFNYDNADNGRIIWHQM